MHDLTILLTLKDRASFTARWMSYASAVGLPFKVVIADGSAGDEGGRALGARAAFPGVDYEYLRFPFDATYADYYAKMHEALLRVDTPFVALADNDDFFVVDGLREAVRFLVDHPDYATCGGQCAIFWVEHSRSPEAVFGPRVQWKCSLDERSVTAATARERMRDQSLRATYPIYYHVRRTADCRSHFGVLRELNLQDLFLVEYVIWFLTAIAGKTKQLETLFMARQRNSPGSSGVAHIAASGDWLGRMLAPSWSGDFARFVDVTASMLAAEDGIPVAEARTWVIDSYRMLVAPALVEDVMKESTTSLSMSIVLSTAERLLRLPASHGLRRLARTIYRRTPWVSPDAVHGSRLRARRISRAGQALEPIRQFLTRA